MVTTRQVAANLAAHIATTDWVPEGLETPIVCLDAAASSIDIGKHPVVVVIPRNTTGIWKTPHYYIDVVLALDANSHVSNPAQSDETPDGVKVMGAGMLLDDVMDALVATIRESRPGALLLNIDVEYSLDSLPFQYATLTLEFESIAVWGD